MRKYIYLFHLLLVTNLLSAQINTVITELSTITCNGGLADLSVQTDATNDFDYQFQIQLPNLQWSNAGPVITIAVPPATPFIITNRSAGSYRIIIIDITNGSPNDTVPYTINQPDIISVFPSTSQVSCFNGNDGSIDLNPFGGTPPLTFVWSNNLPDTSYISGLGSGTYSCLITDSNLCKIAGDSVSYIILQPTSQLISTITSTPVSCFAGNNGTAKVTPIGGTPPYSYLWSDGQVAQTAINLTSGSYTCFITDASGCEISRLIGVSQPSDSLTSVISITNVSCFSGDNGAAEVTVSGGTQPYSYLWSNGDTTALTNGLIIGSYDCLISDANACQNISDTFITEPASPISINIFSIETKCFGDSTGTAFLDVSGGTSPYYYLWDDVYNQTTDTAVNLSSGNYSCIVTDTNGCDLSSIDVFVDQPVQIPINSLNTPVSCFSGNDGTASVSVTSGFTPHSYSWSNGDTTASANGLVAGPYTCTITDANSCIDSALIIIQEPTILISLMTLDSVVLCFGENNGVASVSVTGGTQPYSYLWSNGDTTASTNGLVAGSYICTITDANDCEHLDTINVLEPAELNYLSYGDILSCRGDSNGEIRVEPFGGTTPYNYSWSTLPTQTDSNATGLSVGFYVFTVTDANGCTVQNVLAVEEPLTFLTLETDSTVISCFGGNDGTASVLVSGGGIVYDYSWNTFPVQNTALATGLSVNPYTVTVTDDNGCVRNKTIQVTETPQLVVDIVSTNVTCNGEEDGTLLAVPSGGTTPYTYVWDNINISFSPQTTALITDLMPATNYTVEVIDSNGCPTVTSSADITEPTIVSVIETIKNVSCKGGLDGEIMLNVSGGNPPYTYLWSNTQTTQTATALAPAAYVVEVIDSTGCKYVYSFVVTEPLVVLQVSLAIDHVLCYGDTSGEITSTPIGGTPPYSYAWNNGEINQNLDNLLAGIYNQTVTDFNGCIAYGQGVVTEPATLILGENTTPATCYGYSDGSATVQPQGGTSPYSYYWSNSSITMINSGLTFGQYTVDVFDANGCVAAASLNVGQPTEINAILTTIDVNCYGASTGVVTATNVSGTSPPYAYFWSNGSTGIIINNLIADAYFLTLTDADGCFNTFDTVITENIAISAILTPVNISVNGANDGTISTVITGGIAPYTYSWSGPPNYSSTSKDINGLSQGIYKLTVTDDKGCVKEFQQVITEPECHLTVDTSYYVAPLCHNGLGTFSWTNSGGLAPYTNTLINSNGNFLVNGSQYSSPNTPLQLVDGVYDLTVFDAANCPPAIINLVVISPDLLNVVLTSADVKCYDGNDGSASVSISGGTEPYDIDWGLVNPMALISGQYNVLVTDDNECFDNIAYFIDEPSELLIDSFSSTLVSCTPGSDGTATLYGIGGVLPYTYSWGTQGNQTTQTATLLVAGSITGTITDFNDCPVSTTTPIPIINAPQLDIDIDTTKVSCKGFSDGALSASKLLGTGPIDYLWTNTFTSTVISTDSFVLNLLTGVYHIKATDVNGCIYQETIALADPIAIDFTLNPTNISFNGALDGEINVVGVIGGTIPYLYNWTGPNGFMSNNNSLISNLNIGTYSLLITDANGCEIIKSEIINQPICSVVITGDTTQPLCYGLSGSYGWANSGGVAPYTNVLTDLNTNSILVSNTNLTNSRILTEGNYTVLVVDKFGCQDIKNVTITAPNALTANIITNDPSCFNLDDGSMIPVISGGTFPYNINYGGVDPNAIGDGSYQVVISDINGCSTSPSAIDYDLHEPADIITIINTDSVSCKGGFNGLASVDIIGGVFPYVYSWIPSSLNTPVITNLSAGVQEVYVQDALGCSPSNGNSFGTVYEPLLGLDISFSVVNAKCFGSADGEASAFVSGGTSPYSYLWSNGQTTAIATGLIADTYSCTVIDAKGCSFNNSTIISEPSEILANITTLDVSCNALFNGEAYAIPSGGSGTYNIEWYDNSTNASITGLAAAQNLFVHIEDNIGCTPSQNPSFFNINQSDELQLNTSLIKNTDCYEGSDGKILVLVSGGKGPYDYSWNDSLNNLLSPDSICDNLGVGYYLVLVSDVNGCSDTAGISVGSPDQIVANITVDTVSCNGGADGVAYANPSGGIAPYSYVWTHTGSTLSSSPNLNSSTSYFVDITDVNGCTVPNFTFDMPEPDIINTSFAISNYNGFNISCFDSSNAFLTVSSTGGSNNYLYSDNNLIFSTDSLFTNVDSGSITIYTKDTKGCLDSTATNITIPSQIIPNINPINNVSCNGGSDGEIAAITSGGTGIYSYSWSNLDSTALIIGLTQGNYSVSVIDGNGCIGDESFVLIADFEIINNPISSTVSCAGSSDGSATMIPSGGTLPYSYLWVGGQTVNAIISQPAGSYWCEITDSNGCQLYDTINIVESDSSLSITNAIITHEPCFGDSIGSIELTVNGGSGGVYLYLWNDAQTTATAINLAAGTFTVAITDSAGCAINETYIITEPDKLLAISIENNISCFGLNDGEINSVIQGGTTPYTINWTSSNGFNSILNNIEALSPDDYILNITDDHDCIFKDTLMIIQPDSLLFVLNLNDPLCNNDITGSIELLVSGGVKPYAAVYGSASINYPTNDSIVINALSSGLDSLFVSDANGCLNNTLVNLINPDLLSIASYVINEPSCYDYSDGLVSISSIGGTPPYSFVLFDDDNSIVGDSSMVNGLASGKYNYEVTDHNNCTQILSIDIINPNEIIIIEDFTNNVLCYNDSTASILIDVENAIGNYQIFWSEGTYDSFYISNLNAGTYIATVIDENSCTKVDSFYIDQNEEVLADISTTNATCIASSDGLISINAISGGVSPYEIYINGDLIVDETYFSANLESLISTVYSGPYQLLINDANNCKFKSEIDLSFDGGYQCIDEPIVISPNFDGFNDVWIPILDFESDIEVNILNRWGQLEYKYIGNSLTFSWDGLANWGGSHNLPSSDYYYIIKFNNDNYPAKTGVITLIR